MDDKTPKIARRRMEKGRLAYYRAAPSADHWDTHWKKNFSPTFYANAEVGHVTLTLDNIFSKHLPAEGRILEAGCGLGQVVLALRVRGYEVEGVEWGEETAALALSIKPDLPVRVGDVTALDVPDDHYSGYISLGVVEHRYEGPEPFLNEAHRILKPGGTACISVPYIHPLRRLKAVLGFFRQDPGGLEFYQYAYSRGEFTALIQKAGFQVVDWTTYGAYKGLKDEIALLRYLLRWRGNRGGLRRWLERRPFIESHFGHMQMVICQKVG